MSLDCIKSPCYCKNLWPGFYLVEGCPISCLFFSEQSLAVQTKWRRTVLKHLCNSLFNSSWERGVFEICVKHTELRACFTSCSVKKTPKDKNLRHELLDFCHVQGSGISCWKKIGRIFPVEVPCFIHSDLNTCCCVAFSVIVHQGVFFYHFVGWDGDKNLRRLVLNCARSYTCADICDSRVLTDSPAELVSSGSWFLPGSVLAQVTLQDRLCSHQF